MCQIKINYQIPVYVPILRHLYTVVDYLYTYSALEALHKTLKILRNYQNLKQTTRNYLHNCHIAVTPGHKTQVVSMSRKL